MVPDEKICGRMRILGPDVVDAAAAVVVGTVVGAVDVVTVAFVADDT